MTAKLNGFANAAQRNAAIIAMARDEPDLSMRAIGDKFGGLSAAAVSMIVRRKRGIRSASRLRNTEQVHGELEAISAVTTALAPLSPEARRRAVEYAIEWLAAGEQTDPGIRIKLDAAPPAV